MTKGELSKKKIIEAAGDLFWKNGYTKTGINEILKTTELLRGVAADSDSWGSFCDSFLRAFQEELADKKYYGCPLAVVGMEIAFQEKELAKHYNQAMGEIQKIFEQVLRKDGIAKRAGEAEVEELAALCLAVYEGNLVLYRLSKDQSLLLRMNRQLKAVVGSGI